MLLGLVQPFLRAAVSLELAEISIPREFLLHYTLHDFIFHRSVIDCTFFPPTVGLYFYTLYTTSFILICYLIYYNLSCELQLAMNSRKFLLQAFMPVWFGFFTRPSTIVPLLHRRMTCIFKLFTPLSSFSYAIWSSATFVARWSEPRIFWNFYTPMVSIT